MKVRGYKNTKEEIKNIMLFHGNNEKQATSLVVTIKQAMTYYGCSYYECKQWLDGIVKAGYCTKHNTTNLWVYNLIKDYKE